MRAAYRSSLALSALVAAGNAFAAVTPACVADLEAAARLVEENDAGARDLLADHGPAIRQAFETARAAAANAVDAAACQNVLDTYLRSWRPGHLNIKPAGAAAGNAAQGGAQAAAPRLPSLKVLGKDTLLLVLPSFNDRYAKAVRELVAAHRPQLESHRNWIIDVRSNSGGADGTYAPLLGYLLDGPVPRHMVEFLVTPANIKAQEAVCPQMSDPAACAVQFAPVLAAMRAAAPGSFVLKGGQRIVHAPVTLEAKQPARVALLTDRDCGSTCEQFVLEARSGYRVKVLGRPTAGAIDVSNMRPHPLPSGRVLYYGSTRSTRVPDMRLDGIGIAPDILLPVPKDAAARDAELLQVQRWIEGGSLDAK